MKKSKNASKVKGRPILAITITRMNVSRGASVTSPDGMSASGEAKSVICHGWKC